MFFNELERKRDLLINTIDFNKENFGLEFIQLFNDFNFEEAKGCVYLGRNCNVGTLIKVLPIDKEYPCIANNELLLLKKFHDEVLLTNMSPCLPYYYIGYNDVSINKTCFSSIPFDELFEHLNIKKVCNVIFCEYINKRDMYFWYQCQEKQVDLDTWKSIIFQVLYTLSILQDLYKFYHSDLSITNILVQENNENTFYKFIFNNTEYFIKSNIIIKLWDFELSTLFNGEIVNDFIIDNETNYYNEYNDVHFFFMHLLTFDLPIEVIEFLHDIYPEELFYSHSDETEDENPYIDNHTEQLKKGVAEKFNLPNICKILSHPFFNSLTFKKSFTKIFKNK